LYSAAGNHGTTISGGLTSKNLERSPAFHRILDELEHERSGNKISHYERRSRLYERRTRLLVSVSIAVLLTRARSVIPAFMISQILCILQDRGPGLLQLANAFSDLYTKGNEETRLFDSMLLPTPR
jgi:hypothetical protein